MAILGKPKRAQEKHPCAAGLSLNLRVGLSMYQPINYFMNSGGGRWKLPNQQSLDPVVSTTPSL